MSVVPATASAALLSFDFSTGSGGSLDGTDGNVRTFTATSGSETVKVKVTAWTAMPKTGGGYTVQDAYLGRFSNGLGDTNDSDQGGANNYHTIDNKNGFDFLIFQFDKKVEVEGAYFTPYSIAGSTDSDASIMIGNTSTPYSSPALSFPTWASVDTPFNAFQHSDGGSSAAYRGLNGNNETGNLLFLGASFTSYSKYDGFKIKYLKVKTVPVVTPFVPEPATWAMMITGFGLVGAAMRRRNGRPALA
ncbi:PEPxxWA-CTERM sorting domain-containing protein [Sphingomonas sp. DBB INV C78]|uniref:PEPxxWA-CTERM sorting domain-containing protein n=1 Tax=Sphingomonas sp. DBB INV C78 TaxID=3349434 RepID=UPI0036D2AA68